MEENKTQDTKSEAEVNAEMGLVNRPEINADIKALNLPEDTVAFELTLFLKDGSTRTIWNGMDGAKGQYLFNRKIEGYLRADLNNAKLIRQNIGMCYNFIKKEREAKLAEVSGHPTGQSMPNAEADALIDAMTQEVVESKQELDELRSKQIEAPKQEPEAEVSPNG